MGSSSRGVGTILTHQALLVKQNLSDKGQSRCTFFFESPWGKGGGGECAEKRESFCGVLETPHAVNLRVNLIIEG